METSPCRGGASLLVLVAVDDSVSGTRIVSVYLPETTQTYYI